MAPMEPPMKENSNADTTTGMPSNLPLTEISASFSPVCFCAAVRRSLYFLPSRNLRRSTGSSSAPSSLRPSASRKMSMRARAPIRMWWLHLGQTSRVFSSSGRYSTASQDGHLCHRPSGTELFFTSERMIEGISLSTNQLLMLSFSNSFSARRTTGPACFLRRYAWTAAGCQPSHWRSATAYGADERFDLCTILDALALLHPAADIHGIGFDPGDGLGHVVDGQAAGEDDRLAQARWYQGPVERRAGSPGHAFHVGIEKNPAGTRVSVTGRGDVVTGLDPQRLDIRTVISFALLAGFIAMEL